jgi:fumarate hydratase class II
MQVCVMVLGNDVSISIAGQSANFELNVMLPVAARTLLHSIRYLGTATRNFAAAWWPICRRRRVGRTLSNPA